MTGVNIDLGKASDLVSSIGGLAGQIRSAITGDISPEAKAKLEEIQANADAAQQQAQALIDQAEATNPNLFVSGWRPAVGWVCATAFAFNFLVSPIVQLVAIIINSKFTIVQFDLTTMLPVLLGMLGLGAYRTIEKNNGSVGLH